MTPVGNITNMQMSISRYRKAKIKMLEKEFLIPLKADEKDHINSLQTEAAIDRYVRTILQSRWD